MNSMEKPQTLSKESIKNELARLKSFNQILNGFDTTSLSSRMYYDFRILRQGIQNTIFQIEEMEPYTKNPMTYAGALDLNIYIKRNFAPVEERLKSIIDIENAIPAFFSVAKSNLDDSLAKPFIETAIQIANGSAEFLGKRFNYCTKRSEERFVNGCFQTANNKAIFELKSFVEYLEKRNFRSP